MTANRIMAAYIAVGGVAVLVVGITIGIVVEIVVGGVFMAAGGLLCLWALRRESR